MSIRDLSFVLLLSAVPVVAQEPAADTPKPPAGASTAPAPKRPAPPAAADAANVSLEFAGGTLAAFCDVLRQMESHPNIVVAPLAAEAKLPAMSLRGAGLEEALSAACAVAVSEVRIGLKGFHGAGESVFTIQATPPPAAAPALPPAAAAEPGAPSALASVDGFRVYDSRLASAPSPRGTVTRVFSLNSLLAGWEGVALPVETILTALEVALDAEPAKELHAKGLAPAPASSATLRFHKDSGLLIVRGSPEQLALAKEALGCLEADLPELVKRHAARPGAGEPAKAGK